MVRESMDQDLLAHVRLLRSFEESDDSFTLLPTLSPPPAAAKPLPAYKEQLELDETERLMDPTTYDGSPQLAPVVRPGRDMHSKAMRPIIPPSNTSRHGALQLPEPSTNKSTFDETSPMPLSPAPPATPHSNPSVSSTPSAPATPVTPANGQVPPINSRLSSSSNAPTPSSSSNGPRSVAVPFSSRQVGSGQGQKASRRLSASQSVLQAKKLALQIKELQIQQQDLLRVSASDPVPASPITPRSAASMSSAGPPPTGPLPPIPIPRTLLRQQPHSHIEGRSEDDDDGKPRNGGQAPSTGVANDLYPRSLVSPGTNNAQGANYEGRGNSSGARPSRNTSMSIFVPERETHISRLGGSSKKTTNASSVSLPLEKRNPSVITEETEDGQVMPLAGTRRRQRATTSGSWNGNSHADERASYTTVGSSLHLQELSPHGGHSASNISLPPDPDISKPAAQSGDMSRSVSDIKAKSTPSQIPGATRDSPFPSSSHPNASFTVPTTESSLSLSSDLGGDDMGGDGVLVDKSDVKGVLSSNKDSTNKSVSRARILSGRRKRSSYQNQTRTQMAFSSRPATAGGAGPMSQPSRWVSWLNGATSVTGRGINAGSGDGDGGGGTAATIFSGEDKLDAPGAMPANLPDWSEVGQGGPTSLPIHQIQRDLDFSMRRLLTIQVFEELLEDPLGRYRFRDYLVSTGASTAELDMWLDLQHHAALYQALQANAEALHDIYMVQGSPHRVKFPPKDHRELDHILRHKHAARPEATFSSAQQHLLEHLYNSNFQSFVKQKIIEQAEVKLGRTSLKDSDGLGDCFCLTNPRLRDHPIVLASDGFEELTGYGRSQIIGRNCRFLQGPGTAPDSVRRIRDGLNNGDGCTELLLNYRRDGSPFYCLLCIIPLRDANGRLSYFIGGQTNVTRIFSEGKSLSFLITGDTNLERADIDLGDIPKNSPAMQEYQQGSFGKPSEGFGITRSLSRHAAGSRSNSDKSGHLGSTGFSDPYLSLPNKFGASPSSSNLGGRIGKLFKKPSQDEGFGVGGRPSQRIVGTGAEALIGETSSVLQNRLVVFKNLYSRLVVLKKAKREVIFVTRDLLTYLGLPAASGEELYASPLIHADLLGCINAGDKAATKALRDRIKKALKNEESTSEVVSLKLPGGRGLFPGRTERPLRIGSLHLTPLRERDGSCVAFVGIFGWAETSP